MAAYAAVGLVLAAFFVAEPGQEHPVGIVRLVRQDESVIDRCGVILNRGVQTGSRMKATSIRLFPSAATSDRYRLALKASSVVKQSGAGRSVVQPGAL